MAEAADGAEAVRLARIRRPDLAVIDVAMPVMSGIEAAAQIRAEAPATRILALSMHGDEHYQRRMFAAGAAAYLVKNEASAELIQAIEMVMGGRHLRESRAGRDRGGGRHRGRAEQRRARGGPAHGART